ncbi:hypothetical protein [Actinocorallia aurantiaca]|uniref:Band 7 domain-containing protein n=1 Tax=Actinocorallia aurantiaca TaxID=46204 RepID=A0ABP6G9F8_9ACTN
MNQPYPIVEIRALAPVGKSGVFGLGTRRRGWDELPPPRANQARVYLVGGRHIVDKGRLAHDDETVVEATEVTVVDLSQNRSVEVEVVIPSADANKFTVQATFLCTVTDPEQVVRLGQAEAHVVLLGYLRQYHRLFQLGLAYGISQVNEVRLMVQSQLESYYEHVRPETPGMRVLLTSIEVLTPDELVHHHRTRFDKQQGHLTATTQATLSSDLELMKQRHAEELELTRKRFELLLAEQQHTFAVAQQRSRQELAMSENAFTVGQAEMIHEAVGADAVGLAHWAIQKGEMTAAEMVAGRMEQEREIEARRRELEDRQHALEHQRQEFMRASADRQDVWTREDRITAFSARLDLMKELAKHGHLDEISIEEIDAFMDRLNGQAKQAEIGAAEGVPKGKPEDEAEDEPEDSGQTSFSEDDA